MWKRFSAVVLLVCLCGCFKTKDELSISADGSGKVRIETRSSIPPELSQSMGMAGPMGGLGNSVLYPPTSEADARKFFPGKDFTVTVNQEKTDNGDVTTIVEASFKNINALLSSPYARAHQLSLKIEGGELVFKAVTGMEAVARLAEMQDDSGMGLTAAMPGVEDLRKKKNAMRMEFRVTLPNTVTAGNGTHAEKTASWTVERAACKDADDFAQKLGAVSEARCSSAGLTMAPSTPTRLGLLPFNELIPGAAAGPGSTIDSNQVLAAAKFVPYGLYVQRSLDLSGSGAWLQNGAQLIGAVILPPEFKPQKWGEAKLEEVVDAKGNDLKPGASGEDRLRMMQMSRYGMGNDADDGEEEAGAHPPEERHVVGFSFRPPDWKVKEIAQIKGSISLHYFGGSQVIKLTNAIPANWIVDASQAMRGGMFDSSEKSLNSAQLAGTGLSLSLQMGIMQSGMTMLSLQVKGDKAALIDAEVFDAAGKPWPTFIQQDGMDENESCQLMVPGKPKPPLSLAFQASGNGSAVTIPIRMEHVPLTNQ